MKSRSLGSYGALEGHFGVLLCEAIQGDLGILDQQIFVIAAPIKTPLAFPDHPVRVQVYYAESIVAFEAHQLSNVGVRVDNRQLLRQRQGELHGRDLGREHVEERDVVAVEQLQDVPRSDGLVDAPGQLPLLDGGKDAFNLDFLVDGVVSQQINFVVVSVAGSRDVY
jgi:hypothetical protein